MRPSNSFANSFSTTYLKNKVHYNIPICRKIGSFHLIHPKCRICFSFGYAKKVTLNAYQNVPAYIANLGGVKIELINSNYEGIFGSDLRIYTTVDPLEAATDVFESFSKAGDPEITQTDFDDFYKYYSLDDGDVRPVIGSISGYIMVKDGKYEIMLDASPDYFDQE